ncbi:unnamed protein product [Parnassius mnemosyne]|uniref:ZAD domain-containing protein n=1 Tax=Parnassius mnemosyne TaxID=213953 RepID=A0AAV1KZL7_9NEOP
MDNFKANSIEENFPNVCRCCLAEGCYKDISSEYFIAGKKEVYAEMLKDVFNLEISYQKYGGPSRHSRLICENCIGKLRDAREFKYKVLASEKSFIKFLDDLQINVKEEENTENNQEDDIILENCAIKLEPELDTENDIESCDNDVLENSQVIYYDDVMGVKLESELNDDNEIESHETSEDQTDGNHKDTFENLQLQLNKDLNKLLTGGVNVCDKRKSTTESNTKSKKPKSADEGTSKL